MNMALSTQPKRWITDVSGNRVGVILNIAEYEALLEAMEELEDIRAYDETKAEHEEVIPFEQAVREIEQGYR